MVSSGRAPRFGLWRVAYSVAALLACRAPGELVDRIRTIRPSLVFLYRLFVVYMLNGLSCTWSLECG